jgi:hypothetical protein
MRPEGFERPGGLHHVTARGNRRQVIFHDDRDRDRFSGTSGARSIGAAGYVTPTA